MGQAVQINIGQQTKSDEVRGRFLVSASLTTAPSPRLADPKKTGRKVADVGASSGRFQNPWDSAPTPSPFDNPVQYRNNDRGESSSMGGGSGSNYMLDSAPVPPPVQKAASMQSDTGIEQQIQEQHSGGTNGYGIGGMQNGHVHGHAHAQGHGGTDVEMVA